MEKMGVFSPCASMDSASMIRCLQALLDNQPSIKFHSVAIDKKFNGFKVFFTEPRDSVVLEKNLLSSEGQPIWIYPQTTYLMIVNVDNKKSPLFERDLRDTISKKFGRVVDVRKTPSSNFRKNWRIEIETPEFKDLEVFKSRNFSEIILPIPGRNEEVALKFWCRQCETCGHFQHECLARNEEEYEENDEGPELKIEENYNNADKFGESSREQSSSSPDRKSQTTPKRPADISLETTKRYAEKIGREEVISKHLQHNTIENTERNISNNLFSEKEIKREVTDFPERIDEERRTNLTNNKSENLQIINKLNTAISERSKLASSEDDDEIEYIGSMDTSANKSPSNASSSSFRAAARNYEEESRSSPEAKNTGFPSFTFPSNPGPSLEYPSATLKTPKGAEVTTALSERLQDCINEVCSRYEILDRKQLDAFLIHVKKKSNPIRVALNYTHNTKGLKEQLQGILHMYYNTPQTGTKEDIQFIKWLNGLVDRYDGSIPKKRKRSGKTDDEPSSKR